MTRTRFKIIFPILIFCISFTIFSKCVCPTIYVGDSGELVTAASSLGIPHNPGYPIYSMLGKILTFFPFGSIAYRLNLTSAIFGASSVLTVYFILLFFFKNKSISALITLIYTSISTFWNVSVSSEVYSLYAFFISLLILSMLLFRKHKDLRYLYLLIFTTSLAITNHIEIIMLLPAFLPPIIYTFTKLPMLEKRTYKKILLTSILLLLLGISIYGYLPIRASSNPTVNWSDTKTFSNLLYHISFKEHRTVALQVFSWEKTFDRTMELAKFFLRQFPIAISIFFCILSLIGIIGLHKQIDILVSMLLIFTFDLIYILFFNNVPLSVTAFGFPSYIVSVFLITSGIIRTSNFISFELHHEFFKPIVTALILVLYITSFMFNYHADNREKNYCSYDFIRNMMLIPPKEAVLFVDGDNQTFLSMYMKGIEGFRKDLDIYSYTMSSCSSLDSFKGYIYSNKKESFHPREIESKIPDKSIFYSANPMNLKHTKFPLKACGVLYTTANGDFCKKSANDIWIYQDEDCLLDKKIYKDILTRELTAKYFLRKGGFEYTTGDIEATRKSLEIAAIEGQDIYFLLYEIALEYIGIGDDENALNLLNKAIKIKKDFIEGYLSSSDVLRVKGKYPEAIEILNSAYSREPNNSLLLSKLGEILNEMGEYKKAIVFLEKSIKNNSEDPINYYNLGNSYLGLEQFSEAINNYNLAISMGIKDPEVFNNMGNALKASGDYYGAASKYQEALNMNPDYVPALNNLGLILTRLEKYDHAVELYKKAILLDPNIAGIYCNLGTLYNDYLKDPMQAELYWGKYLSLEPESKEAGIISTKLTEIRLNKK